MIRLIASDIDGTLLFHGPDDPPDIDPAVFAEIRRLREKGILFCPASGRQYSSLRRIFGPVADQLYYICSNGSVVFGPGDPGPVLRVTEMERDGAIKLAKEILAIPQCEVVLCGERTSWFCPKHDDYMKLFLDLAGKEMQVLPAPGDMPEPITKVTAYCREGTREPEALLAPRWQRFHPAVSGPVWLDFTQADKGIGLSQLADALGIDRSQVMAFGDNYNDIPMLEYAGHPYLMETADPPLLERFPSHCHRVEEILRTL